MSSASTHTDTSSRSSSTCHPKNPQPTCILRQKGQYLAFWNRFRNDCWGWFYTDHLLFLITHEVAPADANKRRLFYDTLHHPWFVIMTKQMLIFSLVLSVLSWIHNATRQCFCFKVIEHTYWCTEHITGWFGFVLRQSYEKCSDLFRVACFPNALHLRSSLRPFM